MRRAWVAVAVLVLGAWTCAPVTSGGGEPMAGVSTTGLAALVAGEDWHYVGEAGEPAFQNGWVNTSGAGYAKVAFRIREAGVVDLIGVATGGTAGTPIFRLPAGYIPDAAVVAPTVGENSSGDFVPALVIVQTDGDVIGYSSPTSPAAVWFGGSFFLQSAEVAP